jgi:hypothetical protein
VELRRRRARPPFQRVAFRRLVAASHALSGSCLVALARLRCADLAHAKGLLEARSPRAPPRASLTWLTALLDSRQGNVAPTSSRWRDCRRSESAWIGRRETVAFSLGIEGAWQPRRSPMPPSAEVAPERGESTGSSALVTAPRGATQSVVSA